MCQPSWGELGLGTMAGLADNRRGVATPSEARQSGECGRVEMKKRPLHDPSTIFDVGNNTVADAGCPEKGMVLFQRAECRDCKTRNGELPFLILTA